MAVHSEGVRDSIKGFRSSDGSAQPIRLDNATNTINTIDYAHHEIHAGSHYVISGFYDLGATDVTDIQITTPNTTKWAHMLFEFDCESETQWFLYENVTILLAGTGLAELNSDRNSGTAATVVTAVIQNTSVANANLDTAIAAATIVETGLIGGGRTGGHVGREHEIILKQNEDYSLRFIANVAGVVAWRINWYEHTNLA